VETKQEFADKWLDRAVEEFDRNPRCLQLIRRLAEEDPVSFANAAMRHLGGSGQSAALRYLAALMVREKSIFEKLSDPGDAAMARSQSVVQRLLAVDPSFDIKFAKQLPDRTGTNHKQALTGARGVRAMEVLDKASASPQVVPIVSHLVDSDDPRLSAGTALFVGRRTKNPDWAERLLDHGDSRVRANAVEALWGVNSSAARKVLETALVDESNRVVGNCLVGLSQLGKAGAAEEVMRMAEDPLPRFRATAAWAMGEIGHSVFLPHLTALVKDESEVVRRTALRALLLVRREEAARPPEVARPAPAIDPVPEAIPQTTPMFELRLDGSSFSAGSRRRT
jgi:hypothetical protein